MVNYEFPFHRTSSGRRTSGRTDGRRRVRTEPLLRLASALEDLKDTRLERLNGRDVVGEAVERAYVVVSVSSPT